MMDTTDNNNEIKNLSQESGSERCQLLLELTQAMFKKYLFNGKTTISEMLNLTINEAFYIILIIFYLTAILQ